MTNIHELRPDEKGKASLTFADVIWQTRDNYPDPRFRPRIYERTPLYTIAGIDPSPYSFWVTADGIGTKPELAERLTTDVPDDPRVWEGLPFDVLAMIDGDEARFGRYLVGVAEIVDMNTAGDKSVVNALARGLKAACDEGQFALLNGETAELGYRTSGYGKTRINWNAVGVSVVNPDKLILGKNLKPGQPIVAFREKSIRSNGLSKARLILETAYLLWHGINSKETFVRDRFADHGVIFDVETMGNILTEIFGHEALEQVLLPWHEMYPATTKELLLPSRIYGPAIREAQGKIDEPPRVKIVAAAHITGGGVPEKAKRMVESKGLGVALNTVFPDPSPVRALLELAGSFPEDVKKKIKIDNRIASEQWNRGVGFLAVTEDLDEAKKMVGIAESMNYEAAIAGEIIDKPEIHWRGNVWQYQ